EQEAVFGQAQGVAKGIDGRERPVRSRTGQADRGEQGGQGQPHPRERQGTAGAHGLPPLFELTQMLPRRRAWYTVNEPVAMTWARKWLARAAGAGGAAVQEVAMSRIPTLLVLVFLV